MNTDLLVGEGDLRLAPQLVLAQPRLQAAQAAATLHLRAACSQRSRSLLGRVSAASQRSQAGPKAESEGSPSVLTLCAGTLLRTCTHIRRRELRVQVFQVLSSYTFLNKRLSTEN
jgi:hypothetical protein